MMRKGWFQIVFFMTLLSLSAVSHAKTSDEYLKEVYQLIEQKQYEEALALVRKGAEDYPGDLGLTIAFAEIYHLKGDYETAIMNYVNIMRAITSAGEESPILAHYHHNLVDAYNELGQKHYFPEDLCLRIIYHMEKVFELNPSLSEEMPFVEFLRKSIGHYDMAKLGVKMMEEGGDGEDFALPEDYVSPDEKMRYLDKAMERIKKNDFSQKESAFQATTSDKTVDDIIGLINEQISKIKSIHFKRTDQTDTLIEEIVYKSPDKIKVIWPDAISILNGTQFYVIDPQSQQVIKQDTLDPKRLNLLPAIGFHNPQEFFEDYNWAIEKIVNCPSFLNVCSQASMSLYLITGTLKATDGGPYSPTPTMEYFIDGHSGLCVVKREYWNGILGSGKKEELAVESIVTDIKQAAEGVSLASRGLTKGHVQELSGLNQEWEVTVLAINQGISDQEFVVLDEPATEP